MKKCIRQFFAFFLCLVVTAGLLPVAFAEGETEVSAAPDVFIAVENREAAGLQVVGHTERNAMSASSVTTITLPVFYQTQLYVTNQNGDTVKATWKSSNPTVATVDSDGVVSAWKYGSATITATTSTGTLTCKVNTLFFDVTDSSLYYYKPVYWAAEKGITKGYDLEYFAPQYTCIRGDMVMFLWRMAGKPTPKNKINPFSDVSSSDYYYTAVLWAVEKKITNGYEDGTFRPNDPCTREQAVTFLWRLAGKPNPKTTKNPFSDVASSDYYYKATLWASENAIAKGYEDGTYGVGYACLREHMVTFLYRYFNKFGK